MGAAIVLALPQPTFGGAERLAAAIAAYLGTLGLRVSVAIASRDASLTDSTAAWFAPVAEVHHLHAAADPAAACLGLLAATRADCLALIGRSPAYDWGRDIAAARPDLRLASFQFNAVECIEENRALAPFLDVVIAESLDAAMALDPGGLLGPRLRVISSGVDARRLADRPRPAARATPLVAYVGRFDGAKNPAGFVRMVAAIGAAEARFLMVGDGPGHAATRRLAAELGVADRIAWAGLLGDAELERRLDEVDVLVVPSRIDGRPLVVQEAQARGIAVVASRCGGIPDLVQDGETGLLCPPDDDEAFARAVLGLIASPARRAALGAAARRRVLASGDLADVLPRYAGAITGLASFPGRVSSA